MLLWTPQNEVLAESLAKSKAFDVTLSVCCICCWGFSMSLQLSACSPTSFKAYAIVAHIRYKKHHTYCICCMIRHNCKRHTSTQGIMSSSLTKDEVIMDEEDRSLRNGQGCGLSTYMPWVIMDDLIFSE